MNDKSFKLAQNIKVLDESHKNEAIAHLVYLSDDMQAAMNAYEDLIYYYNELIDKTANLRDLLDAVEDRRKNIDYCIERGNKNK